ncbi:uncharacterized protein L3040_002813 [Drepanopeziza brunnea f. sp. 'multigermtubi']|uniref:uncharacterized protein n=1 Tax=Drepanopeziza brunnea f. sp. 'multigermtubi' TaxID=698441 RepID=UPI0023A5F341|nr:hypothetical protein L3040_002813 [Drepanopeziza brunnea f. sp. 'multigermtubi']
MDEAASCSPHAGQVPKTSSASCQSASVRGEFGLMAPGSEQAGSIQHLDISPAVAHARSASMVEVPGGYVQYRYIVKRYISRKDLGKMYLQWTSILGSRGGCVVGSSPTERGIEKQAAAPAALDGIRDLVRLQDPNNLRSALTLGLSSA